MATYWDENIINNNGVEWQRANNIVNGKPAADAGKVLGIDSNGDPALLAEPAQVDSNKTALLDLGTALGVDMTSCTATTDAGVIDFIADNYVAPSGGGATIYIVDTSAMTTTAGLEDEDFVGAWFNIEGEYDAILMAVSVPGEGDKASDSVRLSVASGSAIVQFSYVPSTGALTAL